MVMNLPAYSLIGHMESSFANISKIDMLCVYDEVKTCHVRSTDCFTLKSLEFKPYFLPHLALEELK